MVKNAIFFDFFQCYYQSLLHFLLDQEYATLGWVYIDMIHMNIKYYLIRTNPFTVVPVYYKSNNIINVHNVAYESKA